jgi:hypothetical protein
MVTKINVPKRPVTALRGISESVNVRERISTNTMNVAPKVSSIGANVGWNNSPFHCFFEGFSIIMAFFGSRYPFE